MCARMRVASSRSLRLRATCCVPRPLCQPNSGRSKSPASRTWDGGYLGNPALNPLIDVASDLLLVLVNPLGDPRAPPIGARQILDRLNQITFNASVVLEANAIEAVNRVLAAGAGSGGKYKPVRLHLIRNERFLGSLGFVSKSSTSWPLLEDLFEHGRAAANAWVRDNLRRLGRSPSVDLHAELITPLLNG